MHDTYIIDSLSIKYIIFINQSMREALTVCLSDLKASMVDLTWLFISLVIFLVQCIKLYFFFFVLSLMLQDQAQYKFNK